MHGVRQSCLYTLVVACRLLVCLPSYLSLATEQLAQSLDLRVVHHAGGPEESRESGGTTGTNSCLCPPLVCVGAWLRSVSCLASASSSGRRRQLCGRQKWSVMHFRRCAA